MHFWEAYLDREELEQMAGAEGFGSAKKLQVQKNGERIHQFCVGNGSKGCCDHGAENDEYEFKNTAQAVGGPNLGPTIRYV